MTAKTDCTHAQLVGKKSTNSRSPISRPNSKLVLLKIDIVSDMIMFQVKRDIF